MHERTQRKTIQSPNDIKLNDKKLFIRFFLFFVSLLYTFLSNYARLLRHTGPFVQEYTPSLRLVAIFQQLGMNIQNIVCNFFIV